MDICFTCELFARLNPDYFVVSPLPIADGVIHCAHGAIPSPAPAVQAMLPGIPVRPFGAEGETVTPTALALLKAFNPTFGGWPMIVVEKLIPSTVLIFIPEFLTERFLFTEQAMFNPKLERLRDFLSEQFGEKPVNIAFQED